MNLEEKDIITLSNDKDYRVVRHIILDGVNYYYVANVKDPTEFKFLYEEGENLIQIHDDNQLVKVLSELVKTVDIKELANQIEE